MSFRSADPHKIPIDPNGNLASKTEGTDTWTYEWNASNELTRVTKNSIEQARFAYDPLGRRVEKAAAGVTTAYTFSAEDILREVRGAEALTYVHGQGFDEPLAESTQAGILYFHTDALGSVIRKTNSAGVVALERAYDAWGNPQLGAAVGGYAFTGREWDPELSLYYYRARLLDSAVGRFIAEDPAGFVDDMTLYSYVANRPADATDPTGLALWLCTRRVKGWMGCAGGNHVYIWSDYYQTSCGAGNQMGQPPEKGPSVDACHVVPGTNNNPDAERRALACCRRPRQRTTAADNCWNHTARSTGCADLANPYVPPPGQPWTLCQVPQPGFRGTGASGSW